MNRPGWFKNHWHLVMSAIAACLMVAAGAGANTLKVMAGRPLPARTFDLESAIPKRIGQWEFDPNGAVVLADPQTERVASQIYTQLIARTYLNANTGDRIMLSIAYGDEQHDTRQIHLPEVCYPAQGFQIALQAEEILQTDKGTIEVRRLVAATSERIEPITYWITVGNKVVMGDFATKIEQIRHRYRGDVPDGVIFRVSSISRDPERAFQLQSMFVQEFVRFVPSIHLPRLTGMQPFRQALNRAVE